MRTSGIDTNCNHRTMNKHPKTKSDITSSLSKLEFPWKQSQSHQVQLHAQKQIPKNKTPRCFWYDDIVLLVSKSVASSDISLWVRQQEGLHLVGTPSKNLPWTAPHTTHKYLIDIHIRNVTTHLGLGLTRRGHHTNIIIMNWHDVFILLC